ncbi:MAG: Apolipoprotein N-acyltransferase [Fimbriimonadaceae bacterium]|nr:Apolipoprotein N-acyltransferase [Fimbriimonadaceae bacterium]
MHRLRSAGPVVASVLLYWLAFPPVNLLFLVFVALAPWFVFLRTCSGKQAFRSGLLFGLLFWLLQMTWIVPFVGRWTQSIWLGMVPWLLIPTLGIWYFGLLGWLIHRCWAIDKPWLIPVVWIGVEAFRAFIPIFAYPWGILAFPLAEFPILAQLGALGTVYTVSGWCSLGSVVAAMWLGQVPWARIRGYAMVLVVLGVASALRFQQPIVGENLKVTLGQIGVDQAFSDPQSRPQMIRDAADETLRQAERAGAQLLVLPEAVTSAYDDRAVLPFTTRPTIPVLLGAHRRSVGGSHQSAFLYANGQFQHKDKLRLVIFGEFVPFRDHLPFLKAFNLPGTDMTAGTDNAVLKLSDRIRIGTLVCFEALFSEVTDRLVAKGANLLAVISVDDWYMGTVAPNQLRQGTIWRSIESGLPLVRVGSLGYSLATDARGTVTYQLPTFIQASPTVNVWVPEHSDAFAYRWVVPWIGVAGCIGVIIQAIWRRQPKSSS